MSTADELTARLRGMANPRNLPGMARYGINTSRALGVNIPLLRAVAKECGKDHALARALWSSGIHEARILAAYVEEPAKVTPTQMDRWAARFDSWDLCDQVCGNLFDRTPHAYEKAVRWSGDKREFVKRAGFVMMAVLSAHDKKAGDERFLAFLPLIRKGAEDPRNFVKKAVNWALRQIGKRSGPLRKQAIAVAQELAGRPDAAPRWVGKDALRELKTARPLGR